MAFSDKDLNLLYDAALEFGKNWRRPVAELAVERLSPRSSEHCSATAYAVEQCRSEIESRVWDEYERRGGRLTKADLKNIDAWIAAKFPWMTRMNRKHAISQGWYYAWHG